MSERSNHIGPGLRGLFSATRSGGGRVKGHSTRPSTVGVSNLSAPTKHDRMRERIHISRPDMRFKQGQKPIFAQLKIDTGQFPASLLYHRWASIAALKAEAFTCLQRAGTNPRYSRVMEESHKLYVIWMQFNVEPPKATPTLAPWGENVKYAFTALPVCVIP